MSEAAPAPFRRRAMTRAEVIAILEGQGADLSQLVLPKGALKERELWNHIEAQGIKLPCGNTGCDYIISTKKECIRDHKISLRSVPEERRREHDQPWNQWYLCLTCNSLKTHKRGLTGLGSDAARIAKLRRAEKRDEKPCRPKRAIPNRAFPKTASTIMGSPTIPSRPFPKGKRPMPSRPMGKSRSRFRPS